ncbi:MAG TPA: 3'-5' exonuclease [Opitutaceae bacterium]|nr:3'-5' exonuclease [Opitutaceae bacterium]
MSWTSQVMHFIDFEGGLACGVLEYGVVTLRGGRIEAAEGRLCAPAGRIAAEDIAVHGLTPAALAGFRPFADDWERFAAWRQEAPFAAHFAGMENSLIKAAWPAPRPSADFIAPDRRSVEWGPWIDTARLYAEFYPHLGSQRLENLVRGAGLQPLLDRCAAQYCPEGRRRYHAALYDAVAGALLLCALANEPRCAGLSTAQLLVLSTRDPGKREAMTQPELW